MPITAVSGTHRICAAVTDTPQAAFACQNFTVDTPAPGSVTGQLPLSLNASPNGGMVINSPADLNAAANLYDRQGNIIASAPVNANGSFSLSNVPPGTYTAAVVGIVQEWEYVLDRLQKVYPEWGKPERLTAVAADLVKVGKTEVCAHTSYLTTCFVVHIERNIGLLWPFSPRFGMVFV